MADGKPYVFISRADEDKPFADWLEGELNKAGVDTWIAQRRRISGRSFSRRIQNAVKKCGAMIVVMSADGEKSTWIENEFLYAAECRKHIFIVRTDDTILPIYMIARDAIDFRNGDKLGGKQQVEALTELLDVLGEADLLNPLPEPKDLRQKRKLDPKTNPLNFFKFLRQLPDGSSIVRVAQEIYKWARGAKLSIEFAGIAVPSLHARLKVKDEEVIVVSVLGYSRQPSVEVPFQRFKHLPPYDDAELRISTLDALNRLLPDGKKLPEDRADALPRLPLATLADDDRLVRFTQITDEVVDNLRRGGLT
jgi:hypothetical protein